MDHQKTPKMFSFKFFILFVVEVYITVCIFKMLSKNKNVYVVIIYNNIKVILIAIRLQPLICFYRTIEVHHFEVVILFFMKKHKLNIDQSLQKIA